jgi:uncharacterized repeat protein (TIGR01451 family)
MTRTSHGARLALFLLSFISLGTSAQVFTKITTGPVVSEGNNSYYATWGDYDKDGDPDLFHSLFFASISNPTGNNLLFQNNCNGDLTRVNQIPGGLVTDGLTGSYSYWIDYDNDGDLDMYAGPKYLYQNQGNGSFIKVNKSITTAIPQYPLYAEIGTAAWADYDNDGYLDLYFGKQEIHRNNHNGDWTKLNIAPFTSSDPNAAASAVIWGDYDNDGYMDIFVSSAGTNVGQAAPNHLYRNLGNGNFASITTNSSMINTRSYGSAWVDYDNDLDLDLFIAGVFGNHDKIFTNNGNGTFTEVLTGPVVSNYIINQGGAGWADYDNDGDVDLYVTNFSQNILYNNNGNGTFTLNTSEIVSNDTPMESYGAGWSDYDNDGDLDLFVPTAFGDPNDNFYKNNICQNNAAGSKWFKLHCSGVQSNRDAIGARVYIKAVINGVAKWQMREINANSTRGGESGGASGHVVHFGLGDASMIDSLKIVWPKSGITQVFTNVSTNRFVEITEGVNSVTNAITCTPDLPLANPGYIAGKVYKDVNNNCTFDAGTDFPIANKEVKIVPGTYFAFTDENGNYKIGVPAGSYTVSLNQQNDYISLNTCQASSYSVNVIAGNISGNKNFATSLSTMPCGGLYNIAITPVGIVQGPCPNGLLLTNPCPGYCHQYTFNITNNSSFPSNPNSVLAVNFPTGFQLTSVTGCSVTAGPFPAGTNSANLTIPNSIPVGGSCMVSVVVCLQTIMPGPPWTITADFNNTAVTPVNLLQNPQFNMFTNFGPVGFATQYGNPPGVPNWCVGARDYVVGPFPPSPCFPGWGNNTPDPPNALWANGSTTIPIPFVWRQVITVAPNTTYTFNGLFTNLIWDGIVRPNPNIEIRVNSLPQGASTVLNPGPTNGPLVWVNKSFSWCSGATTSAIIEIRSITNQNTGNDFAMDNFSFIASPAPQASLTQTASCSCDPNDKSVTPSGCGPEGNIGKNETLTYRVRFHNLGTGPAKDVSISDKLSADLDISTFKVLSSTHAITSVEILPGNNLVIRFEDIYLPADTVDPAGSHGEVVFSISPKTGLADGTVITNQAGIYFDNNDVVLTQTTINTLYDKPDPEAYFSYKHSCASTGYAYDFTYTGDTPDNATYQWTFAGATPSTSTLQNPTGIVFTNGAGYKKVKLVVNRNGCSNENNDTIQVNSGFDPNGKVLVCHNGHLLSVSPSALEAHLAHGDCVGECSNNITNGRLAQDTQSAVMLDLSIVPNPAADECMISVSGVTASQGKLYIEVRNAFGQLVTELYNESPIAGDMSVKYDTRGLKPGIYFIKTTYGGQVVLKKLLVQH